VLLVRYLTLGSIDCPTDPTVTPLKSAGTLRSARTVNQYTGNSVFVKWLSKVFL